MQQEIEKAPASIQTMHQGKVVTKVLNPSTGRYVLDTPKARYAREWWEKNGKSLERERKNSAAAVQDYISHEVINKVTEWNNLTKWGTRDLAEFLNLTPGTIRVMIQQGVIEGHREGERGYYYVLPEEVDRISKLGQQLASAGAFKRYYARTIHNLYAKRLVK